MGDTRTPIVGRAVVFTSSGQLDAYVGVTTIGLKGGQKFNVGSVQDSGGFDLTLLARNEYVELDVQLALTGTTLAGAAAASIFLVPLSKVTITLSDLAWINATGLPNGTYTGGWIYMDGADIDLKNVGEGGATVKLRKYADPNQNALLTTTVQAGPS